MVVFVDTSALLPLLDSAQSAHAPASATWKKLLASKEVPVTTSYVVSEAFAIVQSRLGMQAIRTLEDDFLSLIEIIWVNEEIHRLAVAALLAASRRQLSLVDCASFEVMRARGITTAFALDRDFKKQGFNCLP